MSTIDLGDVECEHSTVVAYGTEGFGRCVVCGDDSFPITAKAAGLCPCCKSPEECAEGCDTRAEAERAERARHDGGGGPMNALTLLLQIPTVVCCSTPDCGETAVVQSIPVVAPEAGVFVIDQKRLGQRLPDWRVGLMMRRAPSLLLPGVPEAEVSKPMPVAFCPACTTKMTTP